MVLFERAAARGDRQVSALQLRAKCHATRRLVERAAARGDRQVSALPAA
jgi:hypothetical protein